MARVVPLEDDDDPNGRAARRRRRRALRGKNPCCRDPRKVWHELPHPEELRYMIRYCKFSASCRISSVIVLIVLAIVFFSLGGGVPELVYQAWQKRVAEEATLTEAELRRPPVVGRGFGGTGADELDEGVEYEYYIPTISNSAKVLEFGARPLMENRGPYRFRVYRDNQNVSSVAGSVQFSQREYAVLVEGSLNDPVVVPNLAYRAIEKELLRIPGMNADSFEEAAIPVLFSVALHELRERGGPIMKRASWAAVAGTIFDQLAVTRHGGDRTFLLREWSHRAPQGSHENDTNTTIGGPPAAVQHPFVLAPPVDGNNSIPIPDAVASLLWTYSDDFSVINAATWTRYVAPITTSVVDSFVQHFRNLEPRYTRDTALARRHVIQIAHWLNDLLRATESWSVPGTEDSRTIIAAADSRAPLYEAAVANLLHSNGLIDQNTWDHVLPGQLGTNALMGFATVKLANRTTGSVPNLAEATGLGLLNGCPEAPVASNAGSSLTDYDPHRLSYTVSVAPEFSCLAYRHTSSSFQPYYTKMSSTTMLALVNALTSDTSVDTFDVPGSLTAMGLLTATESLVNDGRVQADILAAAESDGGLFERVAEFEAAESARSAAAAGSTAETEAYASMVRASDAYVTHVAGGTDAEAECRRRLPTRLRTIGLNCYQIMDLREWVNVIAQDYVWFPRFVWRNIDGSVDPTMLRSGPLLRTTVRELLFGMYDSFYRESRGTLYPGVGPDQDVTEEIWYSSGNAERATLWRVNLGQSDVTETGLLTEVDTQSRLSLWAQVSPVGGRQDIRQFAPTLNRFDQLEGIGPPRDSEFASRRVWFAEMRRIMSFGFSNVVEGPGGHITAWHYEAAHPRDSTGYFESDTRTATPDCMRSIANLKDHNGVISGVDMLIGYPYMLGCDYSALAESYAGMPRSSNITHNSYLEVEPVTGELTRAQLQHSLYLRWSSSLWYPYLRPTIGSLYTLTRTWNMPQSRAAAIRDDVRSVDYQVVVAIPAALHTFGAIFLICGLIFALFVAFPPVEPEDAYKRMRKQLKKRLKREAEAKAEQERKRRELRRQRVDPELAKQREAERAGKKTDAFTVTDKGFETAVERLAATEEVLPAGADAGVDPEAGTPLDGLRGADSVRGSFRSPTHGRGSVSSTSVPTKEGRDSKDKRRRLPRGATSRRDGAAASSSPKTPKKEGKKKEKTGRLVEKRKSVRAAPSARSPGKK